MYCKLTKIIIANKEKVDGGMTKISLGRRVSTKNNNGRSEKMSNY
ncbi:hypothetical protein BCG9842_A0041 (plasmid) [Bacillus cereus G9842]|jgi:hypothetical protein|uniref:Uncharacterized protein n=1 Tax=Bacillus cereus (strain G9842) TaxID=405531 RepID=B7IZN4_BACC2|nr:hypothetical protein BCG9842_A0041 [Bacillus cereus G9842]